MPYGQDGSRNAKQSPQLTIGPSKGLSPVWRKQKCYKLAGDEWFGFGENDLVLCDDKETSSAELLAP